MKAHHLLQKSIQYDPISHTWLRKRNLHYEKYNFSFRQKKEMFKNIRKLWWETSEICKRKLMITNKRWTSLDVKIIRRSMIDIESTLGVIHKWRLSKIENFWTLILYFSQDVDLNSCICRPELSIWMTLIRKLSFWGRIVSKNQISRWTSFPNNPQVCVTYRNFSNCMD